MSLDFTYDYSNHTLLDDIHKYSKIFKLVEVTSEEVTKGDQLLLKTPCNEYGMFIAVNDTSEDGTLHLSKLIEFDFTK